MMKAKARLVARGLSQRQGIDSFATFAPTPATACVHLLRAIGYEVNLDLSYFDAEQASVWFVLDDDAFLRLP